MRWSIYYLIRFLFLLILSFNWSASSVFANEQNKVWSKFTKPQDRPPQIIGTYNSGCLIGAKGLALTGLGYQIMRPSRNRYYGHPSLINFINELGSFAALQNGRLLVGDLSQPWGGPMISGHASHQIGLDADIWFQHVALEDHLSVRETEERPLISVVNISGGNLRPGHWSPFYSSILRSAAESPEVERIFVNPIIKQALCQDPANYSWLQKIRPWWGHADHFHVRLSCPSTDTQCKPQKAIPPGSGCDQWLDQWVEDQKLPRIKKKVPPKPLVLPSACYSLLNNPH
jgi:penicillin-insensitive murein endopeptidase